MGKTAVVTGAASGIGQAMARRFASAGMNIVLADIEEPPLAEAESAVADGVATLAVVTDVSDGDAVDALAAAALERFGAVHVVCNNAGVAGGLSTDGSIDLESWQWVMDVNFWGVVHGHRVFLPLLLAQDQGHIVNTASMAGHFPGFSPYSASKWAVVALSEGLRNDLNERGSQVGVSCLCPGWVNTNILTSDRNRPEPAAPRAAADPTDEQEARRAFVEDQLRSGMPPADVADLVHDAVVDDRFWVFTDPAMVELMRPRYESILAGEDPPFRARLGG